MRTFKVFVVLGLDWKKRKKEERKKERKEKKKEERKKLGEMVQMVDCNLVSR